MKRSKPSASTDHPRLQAWRATSDAVAPDIIVVFVVTALILVGAGVLHPLALFGIGGLISLAAFLYSRRNAS